MEINPRLFDKHGRLRLGRGRILCTRWHPLYPEQPYLAVGLRSGEIIILRVEHKPDERRIAIEAVQEFSPMPRSVPWDLDWGPEQGEDAGRYLAVAEGKSGFVQVLDVEDNREYARFQVRHSNALWWSTAFSPDGAYLAVAGDRCPTQIRRFVDGAVLQETPDNSSCRVISWHPDGMHLATCDPFGILDVRCGQWKRLHTSGHCWYVRYSPNGRYLLTYEQEGPYSQYSQDRPSRLVVRDGVTGELIPTAFGGESVIDVLWGKAVWGPDSERLCYSIWITDRKGIEHITRSVTSGEVLSVVDSGNGHLRKDDYDSISPDILSGTLIDDQARCLRFTYFDKRAVSGEWTSLTSADSICFSPSGTGLIAQSGEDIVWQEYPNLRPAKRCTVDNLWKLALPFFTPDAQYMMCQRCDGPILRYTARGESADMLLEGHDCWLTKWCVSPDARYLVSCSTRLGDSRRNPRMLLHDLVTGRLIRDFVSSGLDANQITGMAISPDGRHVVCTCYGSGLFRVPLQRGVAQTVFSGIGIVKGISPDGTWCVTVAGTMLRRHLVANGGDQPVCDVSPLADHVSSVAISPCSHWLGVVGNDGILLLSSKDWKTRVTFDERYQNSYDHVAFSPDGRYLSVSGHTSTILDLERALGSAWFADYHAAPLILTAVWFPKGSLDYLRESAQGMIVTDRSLARCGECGRFFPVEDSMLGTELRCPNDYHGRRCNRLLKLNPFIAGFQDPEVC